MLDKNLPFGATPIEDSSDLKLDWVKTRDQLNEVEADNILKAASKYFSYRKFPSKWFNETTLKKIHYEMFSDVWNWGATYYKGPLRNIGIRFSHIPIQVRELCDSTIFWLEHKTDLTFLEQSARIHFRLAQIHPFYNGNGRHARLVSDLYLHSLFGYKPAWPEKIFTTSGDLRREYIQSLKTADQGDYSDLVLLMQRYGGKNPSIPEMLRNPYFRKHFSLPKLVESIRNLIQFGHQVNELEEGYHPLQLAIHKKIPEVAFLLIEKGADLNQRDKSTLTPLESAIKTGNQELIQCLRVRIDKPAKDF